MFSEKISPRWARPFGEEMEGGEAGTTWLGDKEGATFSLKNEQEQRHRGGMNMKWGARNKR